MISFNSLFIKLSLLSHSLSLNSLFIKLSLLSHSLSLLIPYLSNYPYYLTHYLFYFSIYHTILTTPLIISYISLFTILSLLNHLCPASLRCETIDEVKIIVLHPCSYALSGRQSLTPREY